MAQSGPGGKTSAASRQSDVFFALLGLLTTPGFVERLLDILQGLEGGASKCQAASVCNDWGEVGIRLNCRDEYKSLRFGEISPEWGQLSSWLVCFTMCQQWRIGSYTVFWNGLFPIHMRILIKMHCYEKTTHFRNNTFTTDLNLAFWLLL